MAKRGYNPVSNPNPQVDPAQNETGVMSQGHDGNIVGSTDRNVRYADGPCYGEDCFGDDQSDEDGDFD